MGFLDRFKNNRDEDEDEEFDDDDEEDEEFDDDEEDEDEDDEESGGGFLGKFLGGNGIFGKALRKGGSDDDDEEDEEFDDDDDDDEDEDDSGGTGSDQFVATGDDGEYVCNVDTTGFERGIYQLTVVSNPFLFNPQTASFIVR